MGCFNVTCALTNTPIYSGDKCHLVILRKDVSWDGIEWLVLGGGSKWDIETVFHGEYNDYGTIENPEGTMSKEDDYLLDTFRDHMNEPNNERKHFFICDLAWRTVMEQHKTKVSHWVKERQEMRKLAVECGRKSTVPSESEIAQDNRENEIYRLMIAFRLAAKSPMSGLGLYHQYDRADIAGIRANMALTEKRLQEIEEMYKSWGIDEEIEEVEDNG